MAFAEAATIALTALDASFKPFEIVLLDDPKWQDTTGSGDTAPEWTQGGLQYYSGRITGWVETNGPIWATSSDTLTLTVNNGQNVSGTIKYRKRVRYSVRGSDKKLIVMVLDFQISGATAFP